MKGTGNLANALNKVKFILGREFPDQMQSKCIISVGIAFISPGDLTGRRHFATGNGTPQDVVATRYHRKRTDPSGSFWGEAKRPNRMGSLLMGDNG